MKEFLGKDFLLDNEVGKKLYFEHAAKMPIFDFHCHLQPVEIYEDHKFASITETWLGANGYGDHYKWRLLRELGVDEELITGKKSDKERFLAYAKAMYAPKVLKRLVDELHSPRVHVTLDLYNYLYEGNFESRDAIFKEACDLFKDEIKILHLKDAKLVDGKLVQVAPGQGDFHYSTMLETIKNECPNAVLVFEGVKGDDIDTSYRYMKSLISTKSM